MKTEIIKSSYFKNIEIENYNEITNEYEIININVLNNSTQFISDIFNNNKNITYMDKMIYYINIYKSVLNKNIKYDIQYNTINSLRDELEETIRKINIDTMKYEEDENITIKLISINRAIDSKKYTEINKLLWELLTS